MSDKTPFGYVTQTGEFIKGDILEAYKIKNPESKQAPPDMFLNSYGENGLVQPLYSPQALALLSELNTFHARCVQTKAQDVGGQGWDLKPVDDTKDPSGKASLQELFERIPYDLFVKVQSDIEEIGYGCIEVLRSADIPDAEIWNLLHIPAHTIRIHQSTKKFMQLRGKNQVWFKLMGSEGEISMVTGEPITEDESLRANELIWITKYTSKSDFYGVPDTLPAVGAMYGDISRSNYNISFFKNFGVPAYAVFITGDFEDQAIRDSEGNKTGETQMAKTIKDLMQKVIANPQSSLIMSVPTTDAEGKVEVKFEKLAVETKEASFRLYRMDNRDEILVAHGVDPYRIGVMQVGSLGGNTAIESKKNYKSMIVQPKQLAIENLINQLIIRDSYGIYTWKFKFKEIDTEDRQADLSMAVDLFKIGGITPNQLIRKFGSEFGLEEVKHPMMDAHYINNQPVDVDLMMPEAPENVVKAMEGLRDGIIEVAKKYDARIPNVE